ncbi:hypothetical protein ACXGQW_10045 [Wenyingzhuangia sp. IMCC45533]
MKKTLLYILFIMISSMMVGQQNDRVKKVTEARANFIINELKLNNAKARKFTEIHNNFRTELFNLSRERGKMQKRILNEEISEYQAKKIISEIDLKEKLLFENRMKYYEELKEVLTSKESIKLRLAEVKFKRKLLETLK